MTRPKIDRDLVLHVAKLASLSLSDGEIDRFASELGRIVAHVEQLDGVDTTDVPATAHVQKDGTPWRDDAIRPGLTHDDALSQAPDAESGGFGVPTFVE